MKFSEFLNQAALHAADCIEGIGENREKMGRQTRDFEFEHGDWFARITADFSIHEKRSGDYLVDFHDAKTEVYFEGAPVVVAQPWFDFVEKVIDESINDTVGL